MQTSRPAPSGEAGGRCYGLGREGGRGDRSHREGPVSLTLRGNLNSHVWNELRARMLTAIVIAQIGDNEASINAIT